MSMHKIPLTPLEESGLKAHGLGIGTPSQLSDAFRQGVAWAYESLRQQLAEANNERAWIRRKLKLPEDTKLLSGEVTLAGTMHNVCNGNHGYRAYIESEKCDDKAGKIARLTVQLAECTEQHFKNFADSEVNALLDEAIDAAIANNKEQDENRSE